VGGELLPPSLAREVPTMESELIQALDRLRQSVDELRSTIEGAVGPNARRAGQVYLDELHEMHAKGLIDEETLAGKKSRFLDKF
jgi:hypothetical protein